MLNRMKNWIDSMRKHRVTLRDWRVDFHFDGTAWWAHVQRMPAGQIRLRDAKILGEFASLSAAKKAGFEYLKTQDLKR